ncbi:DUF2231 domain-containing protein [Phytohabitans aurantiacus]|uniref:DUF2231 domain-containing protein n=1 Tax=Phytohabitans aurantiacus TaxID=3016789 RepID=A0ABQ5QLI4_9ACTN|nr:DUF2231 domain-containing protein [Phytohabitans aurantiacus]GLH95560.1 hypothetical protein Pa4123_08320 [Phytohabitans aurantiacus]
MFEEISGLPAHPLLVHAAVVFIPLLAVAGVVYALVPKVRARIGWAVVLLAVGAPLAAYVARESGQNLEERLVAANYSQEILAQVDDHQGYGDLTLWFSLGLGAAALLLVFATSSRARRAPSWLAWVLSAAVIVLAGFTGYYVYKTGDTGANAVWSGV